MRLPFRRRRPTTRPERVVFLTRRGCSLCDAAKPVVARAAADAGAVLEVRDVDADPDDLARWSDQVPVVLLDGELHAHWRVDERALRRALGL